MDLYFQRIKHPPSPFRVTNSKQPRPIKIPLDGRSWAWRHVGEAEPVTRHNFADLYGNLGRKHRPSEAERMELAALAAWIDARRQIGEECRVVEPADKPLGKLFG